MKTNPGRERSGHQSYMEKEKVEMHRILSLLDGCTNACKPRLASPQTSLSNSTGNR